MKPCRLYPFWRTKNLSFAKIVINTENHFKAGPKYVIVWKGLIAEGEVL